MTEMITAERIGAHVAALTAHGPRHREQPGVKAALHYITDRLSGYGYDVTEERFGPGAHEVNVIASAPGAPAGRIVEICAHWDTVPDSPGADDNASGVAGLLEVARVLAGTPLRHGLRFCAFGEEEYGLRGSSAHVARLGDADVDAYVLEMIGFTAERQSFPAAFTGLIEVPERGDFIAAIANEGSAALLETFTTAATGHVPVWGLAVPPFMEEPVRRSDHVPYWDAGRRALFIGDSGDYRNAHYHRPSDVPDTLDLDFAARVSTAVAAAAAAA